MTATALKVNGYLLMPEVGSPGSVPAGTTAVYPKTSAGDVHQMNESEVETNLASAGGGGSAVAPYAETIGDGSTTTFTITHGLGTKDVLVHVYSLTSPFPAYVMSPEHTSTNTITLEFTSPPAASSVRVVVAAYAGVSLTDVEVNSLSAVEGANMTPNPDAEIDASWWVGSGATITRTTSNPDTGAASFLVTASTNGVQSNFNSPILDIPNLKGAYFIEARVRQGTGTSGEAGAVAIRWFDESEVQVGSTVSKVYSFGASYATWRLPAKFPPIGAVKVQFAVLQSSGGVTAGDTFHVDNVVVGQAGSIKSDVLALGEFDGDQLRLHSEDTRLEFVPNNTSYQSDDFAVLPGIDFSGTGLVTIKGPSRTDTGDDVNNGPEIRLEPTGSTTNSRSQIILEANEIEIFQNDNGTHVYVLESGDIDIGASDDITVGATDDLNLNFANLFLNGTEALVGAWATYTPALTASSSNPTLGTGSSATGSYCRIGRLIVGKIRIIFGTSGAAAGSGSYRVSLPAPANVSDVANPRIGQAQLYDASGNVAALPILYIPAAGTYFEMTYPAGWPTGTPTTVTNAAPWTWANNDAIEAYFAYQAAS